MEKSIPYELVKTRFLKLNSLHLEYVIECMQKNTTKIRNIKAYMITALYNAPTTVNHYYQQEVLHDTYRGSHRDCRVSLSSYRSALSVFFIFKYLLINWFHSIQMCHRNLSPIVLFRHMHTVLTNGHSVCFVLPYVTGSFCLKFPLQDRICWFAKEPQPCSFYWWNHRRHWLSHGVFYDYSRN